MCALIPLCNCYWFYVNCTVFFHEEPPLYTGPGIYRCYNSEYSDDALIPSIFVILQLIIKVFFCFIYYKTITSISKILENVTLYFTHFLQVPPCKLIQSKWKNFIIWTVNETYINWYQDNKFKTIEFYFHFIIPSSHYTYMCETLF